MRSLNPASNCRRCPRLAQFRRQTARRYPNYHCRPVLAWGTAKARLLVVGLAPGLHGANRTGRPFTGDASGVLLFELLRQFGWAKGEQQQLKLQGVRVTNAVKCLPPANRVVASEVQACNRFLAAELADHRGVVLALGRVAHDAILLAGKQVRAQFPFTHGGVHRYHPRYTLIDSYHCSRYNTQTGRLTRTMLTDIFREVSRYADAH